MSWGEQGGEYRRACAGFFMSLETWPLGHVVWSHTAEDSGWALAPPDHLVSFEKYAS